MNAAVQGFSLVSIIALIRKEIEQSKTEGPKGEDGKEGAKGERGAKGDTGPQGKVGPKGGDGKQGKAGKDGKDGKDAEEPVGIKSIEQDIDDSMLITMTDGETYTIEMPINKKGKTKTEVHYKVGGGGSGSGSSGSIDLSNYVQKPDSNTSWMVYKKGTGWSPVTTDLVATNPEILFRDAKGRFKTTKNVPELFNQMEVNRWMLEQLEAIEAGGGESYDDTVIKADLAEVDLTSQMRDDVLKKEHDEYAEKQVVVNAGVVVSLDELYWRDVAVDQDSRDADAHLQEQIDALQGNVSGGDGIEDAPIDGQLYVRNGGSWEALPPMSDSYTGTNPSLVIRNANGNSKFQWMTAHGMTFTGTKKENKEDTFVLSGGTDGTENVFRNSIESFRDSMDVYTKAEVDALGVGGGEGGIEEAPVDNTWYARKNAEWLKAPSYAKAQIERASNLCKQVFRQPRDPNSTSADFELSVGPLTRGVYVEDEVEEMAVLANWADYDTITFNPIKFSMRNAEVGDYIEVGDINWDDRTGVMLKLTSVEINETDGEFSGAFGYELVGPGTEDEVAQKGNSYHFHLQKAGSGGGGISSIKEVRTGAELSGQELQFYTTNRFGEPENTLTLSDMGHLLLAQHGTDKTPDLGFRAMDGQLQFKGDLGAWVQMIGSAPSDNKQYVHKNGKWVEFDHADSLKGPTYDFEFVGNIGGISNRPGHMTPDNTHSFYTESFSFYGTDKNGVQIPESFDSTYILEIWDKYGVHNKYRSVGGGGQTIAQQYEMFSSGGNLKWYGSVTYNVRFYKDPDATRQIGRSDLVQTFTELQHAIADEQTIKGLKGALHNALGGLIEKFEG